MDQIHDHQHNAAIQAIIMNANVGMQLLLIMPSIPTLPPFLRLPKFQIPTLTETKQSEK